MLLVDSIDFQNEFIRRQTPELKELQHLKMEYNKQKSLFMKNQQILE